MYGILAACIAGMAMFLGLFALSVEAPDSRQVIADAETPPVIANRVAAE